MPASLYDSPRTAAGYAFARPAVHPSIVERIRRDLNLTAPVRRALDIGCGAGRSTEALDGVANFVVGVDPIAAMLAHHATVAPRARFAIAPAECLPFPAGAFDLITAAGAINYADLDAALPEAARVLAADGVLVVYDFSAGRRFADSPALEDWYAEFERRYPDQPGYPIDARRLPLARARLELRRYEAFTVTLPMSAAAYSSYAMSETRVARAIAAGAHEDAIRDWCDTTLAPVFGAPAHQVVFDAYTAYVGAAPAPAGAQGT